VSGSRAWFEKDFYAVLGVPEGAPADEIKRAYKKIARQYHPDRNPGDSSAEEKMKDASEAYDVLSDAKKREEYDQMRRMSRSGYAGGAPGAGWQSNVRYEDIPFDIEDLLGGMFGGRARGGNGRRRASDVEVVARISFDDAMKGVELPVRVGGVGGAGAEFKVRVPAGIQNGARIRARGRGGEGGDLYVRVEVAPHPVFGREGADLTVTVAISYADAVLGTTIEAPALDGKVKLKVPAGTAPGTTLRARGKGAPKPGGGRGDLLVTLQVEVPKHPSKEERELIEQLAAVQRRARAAV
jgi:molecular chaperone DnaJ